MVWQLRCTSLRMVSKHWKNLRKLARLEIGRLTQQQCNPGSLTSQGQDEFVSEQRGGWYFFYFILLEVDIGSRSNHWSLIWQLFLNCILSYCCSCTFYRGGWSFYRDRTRFNWLMICVQIWLQLDQIQQIGGLWNSSCLVHRGWGGIVSNFINWWTTINQHAMTTYCNTFNELQEIRDQH